MSQPPPKQGRWVSPDPAGLAAVNPIDPQTWNRYAYLGNAPTEFYDSAGLVRTPWGDFAGGGGFGSTWNEFDVAFIPVYAPNHAPEDDGIGWGWELFPPSDSGGKAPLSEKDRNRYNKLRNKALRDISNPDCIVFCMQHGIDPVLLSGVLRNQQAYNGSQSTITQAEAGTAITDPNQTVAQGFERPGVRAAASVSGTDVYFRQGGFLSGIFGNGNIQEGTIEHEALHSLTGLDDEALQNMLGLSPNPYDTTNVTQALKDHKCAH